MFKSLALYPSLLLVLPCFISHSYLLLQSFYLSRSLVLSLSGIVPNHTVCTIILSRFKQLLCYYLYYCIHHSSVPLHQILCVSHVCYGYRLMYFNLIARSSSLYMFQFFLLSLPNYTSQSINLLLSHTVSQSPILVLS